MSDANAHIVNTWGTSTQNLTHVMNAMAMVGIPPRVTLPASDYSVVHGLRAAIEAIAEPTEQQKEMMLRQSKSETPTAISNKGRVICITSVRDDASMKSLEDIFHTVIMQQNSFHNTNEMLKIDHCHLVFINVYPSNMDLIVSDRSLQDVRICFPLSIKR